MRQHCVHLYYGDGKGKTTAAIGLAIRACGAGMRVGFLSFLKDGTSSECRILQGLNGIEFFPCLNPVSFSFQMSAEEKKLASAFYQSLLAEASASHDFNMYILDEAADACQAKLLSEDLLLCFLQEKRAHAEIVLTGHQPSARLFESADYITHMVSERHPYERGTPARDGIER